MPGHSAGFAHRSVECPGPMLLPASWAGLCPLKSQGKAPSPFSLGLYTSQSFLLDQASLGFSLPVTNLGLSPREDILVTCLPGLPSKGNRQKWTQCSSTGNRFFTPGSQMPWDATCAIDTQLCLFATPWIVACQAPLSMGLSQEEY